MYWEVFSKYYIKGGSRGGSLGSNEPPFLLIYSTYWFLLLLSSCLTLACVPVLFVGAIVSIARIDIIATGIIILFIEFF